MTLIQGIILLLVGTLLVSFILTMIYLIVASIRLDREAQQDLEAQTLEFDRRVWGKR